LGVLPARSQVHVALQAGDVGGAKDGPVLLSPFVPPWPLFSANTGLQVDLLAESPSCFLCWMRSAY
jgi:hypothetical protein